MKDGILNGSDQVQADESALTLWVEELRKLVHRTRQARQATHGCDGIAEERASR